MPKPHCICIGREGIRCDDTHCDLASPPGHTCKDCCVICYQALHSDKHRKLWGIGGDSLPAPEVIKEVSKPVLKIETITPTPREMKKPDYGVIRFGDRLETLFNAVGATKERVSKWWGKPCNCAEKQQKLNELSKLAEDGIKYGYDKVKEEFNKLLGS